MDIKLLERNAIDDKRWNGCVHFAPNALPYAYTWYLDNVAETWNGLVLGNYKAVMPLVFNKKWGINYLYQPMFAQQLGVFTTLPITENLVQGFINKIPKTYKFIDICLNELNLCKFKGYEAIKKPNYLLNLTPTYTAISENYSGNLKRNLKTADKANLFYKNHVKPETFVEFYLNTTGKKDPGVKPKHQHTLHRIIYKALHHSVGGLIGVYKNKELIAGNFILFTPSRIINLLPATNLLGKQLAAMPFLIDTLIRINAGQNKILDFEGSSVEGVARFYQSFGAEKHHFLHLKQNNLPALYRLFKK